MKSLKNKMSNFIIFEEMKLCSKKKNKVFGYEKEEGIMIGVNIRIVIC